MVHWYIGVDEAGRGALAGPVCVGAVLYPSDFSWEEAFALVTRRGTPVLRDSKKLSAQQRETLFTYIESHARLQHAAAFVSAETIDTIGISNAARQGAAIVVAKLAARVAQVKILLDAGLSVSKHWEQESFVKGDERIPAISLASIVAKVTRDRHMDELASSHEVYGFEKHKGYGTLEHREAIAQYGPASIHRLTFIH